MKPLACKPELPGGAGCRRHSPVKPAPLQSVPTERREMAPALFTRCERGMGTFSPTRRRFSLGPRTYGATRPVWHCGLPATVRKLPGTQIGACIIELMRVSIRHHLHSVWNPRAARAIQVYRQEKEKAIGTFERF